MERTKQRSLVRTVLVVGTLITSNLMTYMVGVYYVSSDVYSNYQLSSDAVRCQTLLRLQHGATSSARNTWTNKAQSYTYLHHNDSSSTTLNSSLQEGIVRDTTRENVTSPYNLKSSQMGSKSINQEVVSNSERGRDFLMESTRESQTESEWSTEHENLEDDSRKISVFPPLSLNQETGTSHSLLQAQDTEQNTTYQNSPLSSNPTMTSPTEELKGDDINEVQTDTVPTQSSDMEQCEPCYCNHTNVVYVMEKLPQVSSCNCNQHSQRQSSQLTSSTADQNNNQTNGNSSSKVIFVITPTHQRTTQKIDLTSMCYTLMHVPNLVWIVIEDALRPTDLVSRLLQRCKVKSVHLVVHTSSAYQVKKGRPAWSVPRGVEQRNAGLSWLRKHFSSSKCNGVFYFGDDDNKYDLRLFDEIRQTQVVSVWKVAWVAGLKWEGPTCNNGRAVSWHTAYAPDRKLPIDMAGFAIHLCQLFRHPQARVGVNTHGRGSQGGHLETDFLEHFTDRSRVECRGSETEAYVWHSHTSRPALHNERKKPTRRPLES